MNVIGLISGHEYSNIKTEHQNVIIFSICGIIVICQWFMLDVLYQIKMAELIF